MARHGGVEGHGGHQLSAGELFGEDRWPPVGMMDRPMDRYGCAKKIPWRRKIRFKWRNRQLEATRIYIKCVREP